MDDLRVYVLFNVQYFSHIRAMRVDNERLCAMVGCIVVLRPR